ncbi:glyceraldehyde-3-phosphate dehydrogenase-like protein [Athelia psychrophila]|uniref:Glyceraldehyde-3-phosphate dehydrogenase-like protein n=1 Tax=Athelia psychrophila TaxID=1759441 RepID=A0A166TU08_9AGAM|nr:glyceraldehyde-3-phosphate dehydrogenase-like protein [Fibularhizoctonia sp. CBS 109695]
MALSTRSPRGGRASPTTEPYEFQTVRKVGKTGHFRFVMIGFGGDFKAKHDLDRLVVFWTANAERYAEIIPNCYDEVAPSTVFAVDAILEGTPSVNGAPQNTFTLGVIALAEREKSFIGGDDLKSGHTELKSVIAEFFVNVGIKPLSIASYNHLENNDGHNLSSERQFRSKEISKSAVVDDMVDANRLLYKAPEIAAKGEKQGKGEHPDHIVVIKYVPAIRVLFRDFLWWKADHQHLQRVRGLALCFAVRTISLYRNIAYLTPPTSAAAKKKV